MQLPFSNLQVKHWNPGATMPLVLPVQLVCNTPEEVVNDNIRENSRRPNKWLCAQPAHDRVAVICGSGPSLADEVDAIRRRLDTEDAALFALNGAATFLRDRVAYPDFQIILDAQPKTAELIGPARQHLLASQVHPDCFKWAPQAILWHLQVEGIDDLLPTDLHVGEPYALIGAASSVGTTALVVAYALGYRTMHVYGCDSSHRDGESHVVRQPMNDGEPYCSVAFNGKEYRTSLTMKLQAERFPTTARLLEREGCKIHVHGSGLLPDIWNTPIEQLPEREKYQRMWSIPAYRIFSPGSEVAQRFLDVASPQPGDTVADFGSGTGRASLAFAKAGLVPLMIDFAPNCRDTDCAHLPFLEWDLTEPILARLRFGFCADVMEHIPTDDVDKVLANIFGCAPRVFLQISTVHDNFGAAINQELHLTVRSHAWWRENLSKYGEVVYEDDGGDSSIFYCNRHL